MAAAPVPGSGWVVVTDAALWLPGAGAPRRLPWERVDRASWDRDASRLVVVETAPLGRQPARHVLVLDHADEVLAVVHERVTATVAVQQHVAIEGSRGVRVVGRRVPGAAGLSWAVAVDGGLDLSRPELRARAEQALAQVRAEVGE